MDSLRVEMRLAFCEGVETFVVFLSIVLTVVLRDVVAPFDISVFVVDSPIFCSLLVVVGRVEMVAPLLFVLVVLVARTVEDGVVVFIFCSLLVVAGRVEIVAPLFSFVRTVDVVIFWSLLVVVGRVEMVAPLFSILVVLVARTVEDGVVVVIFWSLLVGRVEMAAPLLFALEVVVARVAPEGVVVVDFVAMALSYFSPNVAVEFARVVAVVLLLVERTGLAPILAGIVDKPPPIPMVEAVLPPLGAARRVPVELVIAVLRLP